MWRLWTEVKSTTQLQARGCFTLYSGYKLILIVDDPVATVKYSMIRPQHVDKRKLYKLKCILKASVDTEFGLT